MSNNIETGRAGVQGKAAWIAFGLLTAVYLIALAVRLFGGPSILEVSDIIPWSGLIAFFFLLAGAGAGLLVVAACVSLSLFPSLEKAQQRLYIVAFACFAAAGVTILIDLGRPERVLNMVLNMHLMSPFAWDFIFLALSVALSLVAIFRRPGRLFACVAAASGAMVALVEGVILAVCTGNELWQGALMPPMFLLEGLIAGFAVALFAAADPDRSLTAALGILLAVLLLFDAAEWVHAYAAGTEGAAAVALLVSGPLAPLYWAQILGCTLTPLVLLFARPTKAIAHTAAALALIGIVLGKFSVLLAGQALVGAVFVAYAPSLLEAGLCLGAVGMAGLVALAGSRLVPAWGMTPERASAPVADFSDELEVGRA